MKIIDIRHPQYKTLASDFTRWRLTYNGGRAFIDEYLYRYSKREGFIEFEDRRKMTYCPAFAKAAINEIKNSIFQRMPAISRKSNVDSYMKSCSGDLRGVDLQGSTMNNFIGRNIIAELLSMKMVGVFIDNPVDVGPTLSHKGERHPYLYVYKAEDILSWAYNHPSDPTILTALLLRDHKFKYDEISGLPEDSVECYRALKLTSAGVEVRFYDVDGKQVDNAGKATDQYDLLKIKHIPFVLFELSSSLLTDVADYQIALLNLESSDLFNMHKNNFPMYVDQFDPRYEFTQMAQNPQASKTQIITQTASGQETITKTPDTVDTSKFKEAPVGVSAGRRYPIGAEAPSFIAPPSDPLKIAIAKEKEIKKDIQLLVNLAITNLEPTKMASAESKSYDEKGLESGLSYIGLELEHGENLIAAIWAEYEGKEAKSLVKYPERYSLKTDAEINDVAKVKLELLNAIPSQTYKREMAKIIAMETLGVQIDQETLDTIASELEAAAAFLTPDIIQAAIEGGYLSANTGARILGLPEDEVKQAQEEHAARLARIQAAQKTPNPGAQGNGDAAGDASDAADQKTASQNATIGDTPGTKTRGQGK